MSALELMVCVALVVTSACLSASEIALFTLSRFQLRSLRERFRSAHRHIKRLLGDPGGLLITVLVINEIINITLSSIIAGAVTRWPKPELLLKLPIPLWTLDMLLGIAFTAPIVLLVCEITPKVIAARANRLIAPLTAQPLSIIYDIAIPIRVPLKWLVSRVSRTQMNPGEPNGEAAGILKESDFLLMVEEGHKEGAIQQGELDLIRNVFELDDTTVAEVFTPLNQVQTLHEEQNLKAALAAMHTQKYSRIPVVSTNRRQVVGILYSKDLLRAKLEPKLMDLSVASIMRRPLFVNPAIRLNALFRKFKQQKTHMAVVQGLNGEAIGLVEMSDVLDALFEDLLIDGTEDPLG